MVQRQSCFSTRYRPKGALAARAGPPAAGSLGTSVVSKRFWPQPTVPKRAARPQTGNNQLCFFIMTFLLSVFRNVEAFHSLVSIHGRTSSLQPNGIQLDEFLNPFEKVRHFGGSQLPFQKGVQALESLPKDL